MAKKRRNRENEYIRAFRLPDGRWSIHFGWEMSEKGQRYKERRYPCFWIVNRVLVSISPATKEVGYRNPEMILSLLKVLREKGYPLSSDHARWLRHIAAIARRSGYSWLYIPYQRKRRTLRLRRYEDYWADELNGCDTFCVTAMRHQRHYLSALHEIGHLKISLDYRDEDGKPISRKPAHTLDNEIQAWYWAIEQCREEILDGSYAEMIACFRSYLRWYRALNRNRATVRPVPMVARSFVAEFRYYENRIYKHKITDLANSTTHTERRRRR